MYGLFGVFKTNGFIFRVISFNALTGKFNGSEIRHGIFGVLFEAQGIFWGFDICPHSIIPGILRELPPPHPHLIPAQPMRL